MVTNVRRFGKRYPCIIDRRISCVSLGSHHSVRLFCLTRLVLCNLINGPNFRSAAHTIEKRDIYHRCAKIICEAPFPDSPVMSSCSIAAGFRYNGFLRDKRRRRTCHKSPSQAVEVRVVPIMPGPRCCDHWRGIGRPSTDDGVGTMLPRRRDAPSLKARIGGYKSLSPHPCLKAVGSSCSLPFKRLPPRR
jgi:hypothetical protein